MARVTRINEFMTKIGTKRGMSLTTGFDVQFQFANTDKTFIKEWYKGDNESVVNMFCDEAQLPNVQSAVGQITGRYLGEGSISYPHTRIFTDVSMGFLCDAELTPLKFFTSWYEYIYGEDPVGTDNTMEKSLGVTPRKTQRTNRLAYMDDYVSNVKIMKTESNSTSSNGRVPITYILENAYPYAIDAVPLAYGSSQLTRVNVNLYYTRHTVFMNN